ncbi:acyl carrier protein [Pseudostreptobacillus hongkongensis]|uniref:acyl carrier protein n=1 Tax=Pseudostreptobacillus hongkongensis TaxID=1162717 RepID=UPI0008356E48|nr:acyl carrier protein [Pseudostreptobacillus hongkongensis]
MLEGLKEIILEQLDVDSNEITLDANIVEDLGADSLDIIEIATALEEKYGITIEKEEMKNIVKVGDLINLIENRRTK